MKKFITLLLILNLLNFCKAQKQTINSYGSYIRSHCVNCNIGLKVLHSYQVNVYFSQTDTIPDSISFCLRSHLASECIDKPLADFVIVNLKMAGRLLNPHSQDASECK